MWQLTPFVEWAAFAFAMSVNLETVCRFVNDVLHIRIRKKDVFWGLPVEWSHREVVILTLAHSKLFFKVSKAIEFVASIELLVIFPVAAFNLYVMFGCIRLD